MQLVSIVNYNMSHHSHVTVETFCFHVSNVNKRVLKFACHGCLQYGNIICSVSDFADPTAGIASNVDQILAERDRLDDFYFSMLLKSRSIPDTEWMNSRRLNIVYSHDKVQCFFIPRNFNVCDDHVISLDWLIRLKPVKCS
jgi:hypothetical protein